MKRETKFLKIAILIIGGVVLGFCGFWLSALAYRTFKTNLVLFSFVIIICISLLPFEVALYQCVKILTYIDKNQAFSNLSTKALRNIKRCAMTISGLYIIGLPILYIYADREDAPGIILIGIIVAFTSFIIAVFAAVLEKLLENVIEIKLENDLTV